VIRGPALIWCRIKAQSPSRKVDWINSTAGQGETVLRCTANPSADRVHACRNLCGGGARQSRRKNIRAREKTHAGPKKGLKYASKTDRAKSPSGNKFSDLHFRGTAHCSCFDLSLKRPLVHLETVRPSSISIAIFFQLFYESSVVAAKLSAGRPRIDPRPRPRPLPGGRGGRPTRGGMQAPAPVGKTESLFPGVVSWHTRDSGAPPVYFAHRRTGRHYDPAGRVHYFLSRRKKGAWHHVMGV